MAGGNLQALFLDTIGALFELISLGIANFANCIRTVVVAAYSFNFVSLGF